MRVSRLTWVRAAVDNSRRRRGYNPAQLYLWGVIDAPRTLVVNGAVSGQLYTPYMDESGFAVPPKQLWQLGGATSTTFLAYRSPIDNGGVDGQCGLNTPYVPALGNYTGRVLVYRVESAYSGSIVPDMTTLIGGVAAGQTQTFNGYAISVSAVSVCASRTSLV